MKKSSRKTATALLALILSLLMALGTVALVGCGDDPGKDTKESESDTSESHESGSDTESETDPPQPVVSSVDKTMYMTGQSVSVTVRKSADLTSDAVAYLNHNEAVHVFETVAMPDGDVWAHVDLVNTYGEKVIGYLILANLSDKPDTEEEEPEMTATDLVRFIARTLPSGNELHTLAVRAKPSFEASIVGTVNRDQQVRQVGVLKKAAEDGTVFAKIEFTDETGATLTGYVNVKCLLEAIEETSLTFTTTDVVRFVTHTLPSGTPLWTLQVRKEPTLASSVVGSVARDQEVRQIAIANTEATTAGDEGIIFARIEFTDETGTILTGYVNSGCLAESKVEETDYEPTGVLLYVTGAVNMRDNPSLHSTNVLCSLPKDAEVLEIGRLKVADDDGIIWSYVAYTKAGTEEVLKGYVSSKYLATEIANDTETDTGSNS